MHIQLTDRSDVLLTKCIALDWQLAIIIFLKLISSGLAISF